MQFAKTCTTNITMQSIGVEPVYKHNSNDTTHAFKYYVLHVVRFVRACSSFCFDVYVIFFTLKTFRTFQMTEYMKAELNPISKNLSKNS